MSIRASLHDHQRAWKSGGCASSVITDDPRYFKSQRWGDILEIFRRRENDREDALSMAQTRRQAERNRLEAAKAKGREEEEKPGFLTRVFRLMRGKS